MILATHGIVGSSIIQFVPDTDYAAILNYATTLGYNLPSGSQQVKQNQLVIDLKDGGIWSKLDSFAVFATDGSTDFALIDWKRLVQYTAVNSPAFTTNQGFKGNGTSSYLNTNYNPFANGVNFSQNNASMGVYKRIVGGSGSHYEMGAIQSTPVAASNICVNRGFNISFFNSGGLGGVPATNITNTGLISYSRINNTTYNIFNNGVLHEQVTDVTTGLPNLNFFVLGSNFNGSLLQPMRDQFSMVYLGADLTNEQVNFTNIFNTYINSL